MKYHCGHDGCDVCGARTCAGMVLRRVGTYLVCDPCNKDAVELAIHVSKRFSVVIDTAKPCAIAVRHATP